jgi:hypothetical protein
MDKKYNEFKVVGHKIKGEFVIDRKEPTARGHVMISDRDAEINNMQTVFNGLHYELAEEPAKEDSETDTVKGKRSKK